MTKRGKQDGAGCPGLHQVSGTGWVLAVHQPTGAAPLHLVVLKDLQGPTMLSLVPSCQGNTQITIQVCEAGRNEPFWGRTEAPMAQPAGAEEPEHLFYTSRPQHSASASSLLEWRMCTGSFGTRGGQQGCKPGSHPGRHRLTLNAAHGKCCFDPRLSKRLLSARIPERTRS